MKTCWKCDGIGIIQKYKHINDGRCYECDGIGIIFDTIEEKHEYYDFQEEDRAIRAENEEDDDDSHLYNYKGK